MTFSSMKYWEQRYSMGGNSGKGSQGHLLGFKAQVINEFIKRKGICSVMDLGCGDGNMAAMLRSDVYMGYDVSPTVISRCLTDSRLGHGKYFYLMDAWCGETSDLAMSIDVIFHLVEDQVFHDYMERLFECADHYVIVYSSNQTDNTGMATHVKHRNFVDWVKKFAPGWKLEGFTKNHYPYGDGDPQGSFCYFYFFKKLEV